VTAARELQSARFEQMENIHYNAQIPNTLGILCLDDTSKQLLKTAMERLNLSARAYDRFKVARYDIAAPAVVFSHIAEAIQYRSLDRDGWLG
jgi:magnesium chelatase family protein